MQVSGLEGVWIRVELYSCEAQGFVSHRSRGE